MDTMHIATEAEHLAACLRVFLMDAALVLPEAEASELGAAALELDRLAHYFTDQPEPIEAEACSHVGHVYETGDDEYPWQCVECGTPLDG